MNDDNEPRQREVHEMYSEDELKAIFEEIEGDPLEDAIDRYLDEQLKEEEVAPEYDMQPDSDSEIRL